MAATKTPNDATLVMVVDEATYTKAKGYVVFGTVQCPAISVHDRVSVVGDGIDCQATCGGVELLDRKIPCGMAGETVGLVLTKTELEPPAREVQAGMKLYLIEKYRPPKLPLKQQPEKKWWQVWK